MDCVYEYEDVKKEIEFKYTVRELQEELKKEFVYEKQVQILVKVKTCNVCDVLKTLAEFYKNNTYEDGYVKHCKMCARKKNLSNYYNKK